MKVEKIPSLQCSVCKSFYVIKTENGIDCDDCKRITANTSDLMLKQRKKVEKILTHNFMEIKNEIASDK